MEELSHARMGARRGGLGKKPSNPGLKNVQRLRNVCNAMCTGDQNSRELHKECDKGKNNLFTDLKPDANNKGRKGHTGETE